VFFFKDSLASESSLIEIKRVFELISDTKLCNSWAIA